MKTSIVSNAPSTIENLTYTHPGTGEVLVEEWRDIPGFQNYQISNLGRVLSTCGKKDRIMKDTYAGAGYRRIALWDAKKFKRFYIHQLVGLTFLGNINNYKEINHIDGDKTNNVVTNLEYVSHSRNILHAYETGLAVAPSGKNHCFADQTVYNFYNKFTKEYFTGLRVDLAKKFNTQSGGISLMVRGLITHSKGWTVIAKKVAPVKWLQNTQSLATA